nr:DUF4011 domain-containing protein [Cryobacterium sp. BB307]
MAALLENVGLRPVLVVIPGHAFVGYWRKDRSPEVTFPSTVNRIADTLNFVQSGELALFETTTLCGGPHSESFGTARQRANANLDDRADGLSVVFEVKKGDRSQFVDIAEARLNQRILPIPSRYARPDGTVEIVEYRPQDLTISLLQKAIAEGQGQTRIGVRADDAPYRVKRWKDALLDLSLRNPLINYRFPRHSSVTLMLPTGSLGVIEDLLQSGVDLQLGPNGIVRGDEQYEFSSRRMADADLADLLERELVANRTVLTDVHPDSFVNRMRRIASAAKSVINETGNNNLYLALGMVVWEVDNAKRQEVSSPLILVPVTIKPVNRSRQFILQLDTASAITPNFSLAEKLKQDLSLSLPKLLEPELDDAGIDIDGLFSHVREEITKAGLSKIRVDDVASIGFFDFSTYRLWRDLSDNWPTLLKSPLARHLAETPSLEFTDPAIGEAADESDLDDLAARLPVHSDASQTKAVQRAIRGETFVLQGPPGTGKSQTITNMLANALHTGRRVLFIAEKPAALNVVKDRIEAVGLGAFTLDLHDKAMRPAAVRQQLAAALDATSFADRVAFETAHNELSRSVTPLRRYPERLHARGVLGESAYSARDKALALGEGPALPIPRSFLNSADTEILGQVRILLGDIVDAGTNADVASKNPWSLSRLRTEDLGTERRLQVAALLPDLQAYYDWLAGNQLGRELLDGIEDLDELRHVAGISGDTLPALADIDVASTPEAIAARALLTQAIDRVSAGQLPPGTGPETYSAPSATLKAAATTAQSSFFIGRKKRIAAVCRQVSEYLVPGTEVLPENLDSQLTSIEELQAAGTAVLNAARDVPGLEVPDNANPLEASVQADILAFIANRDEAVAFASPLPTAARQRLRSLLAQAPADVVSRLGLLGTSIDNLLAAIDADDKSIELWRGDRNLAGLVSERIDQWYRDGRDRGLIQLQRWSALRTVAGRIAALGLEDAVWTLVRGAVHYRDAQSAFDRGFYAAVLQRQIDDENLDSFDGPAHDATVRSFDAASELLRSIAPGILGADMIETRGFSGSVTVGAVGELKRELTKTRGGKPIRRLMLDHWHVISRLTPCVLASPDSAVRFLDAGLEPFDLVIFDEASQIKVPHAIGALGRGRSAVIVGDSKQMPPTSVAQVSFTDDGEEEQEGDEIVRDEESILTECVQARVPELMLSWHYRSEDESLIAFSNSEYYDGNLSTFPASSARLDDKGVSFVKIDGQFVRPTTSERESYTVGGQTRRAPEGTNLREAKAIVDEIGRRVHDPKLRNSSIGVVTLNQPQQKLIQSLLEDVDDDVLQAALNDGPDGEEVLVWNLESVQGHERDVILFSIAFSKNERGVVPLNFGPIIHQGGQRRLNVAITRARKQVIVYCSFEPAELRADQSSSQGLKDLRAYLDLARNGAQTSGGLSARTVRPPDRHRESVLSALNAYGIDAVAEVGLSDFKVDIAVRDPEDPSRYVLGILLDGERWYSRATVGDRDALPVSLLRNKMGWPAVERIWMPTWLRDREGELERIKSAVDRALFESLQGVTGHSATSEGRVAPAPGAAMGEPVAKLATTSSLEPAAIDHASPVAIATRTEERSSLPSGAFHAVPEWSAWPIQVIGQPYYLDQLFDPPTVAIVRQIGVSIVAVEGPVEPGRFARLIGQSCGMQRVTAKRVQDVLAVPQPELVRDNEGFFYLSSTGPDAHAGWARSQPGSGRPVEEISLVELVNAMRDVATVGLGASREELVRSTALAFGISRVTAGIRKRLDAALESGVARGVLGMSGDYVIAL